MLLPGQLSRSTLGDLLGALHRADTSGTLELCEGSQPGSIVGRRHAIHLRHGLVADVETTTPVTPVGELLVQTGDADRLAVRAALLRRQKGDERPTGELLVGEGLVDAAQVSSALRTQLRQKLEAMFSLRDAVIAFRPPRPSPTPPLRPAPLHPLEFLERRPRRRARTEDGPTSPLAPLAKRRALSLFGLRDGASAADIRRAFRRMAAKLHPDRDGPEGGVPSRAAHLAKLSAAYHLLTQTP